MVGSRTRSECALEASRGRFDLERAGEPEGDPGVGEDGG